MERFISGNEALVTVTKDIHAPEIKVLIHGRHTRQEREPRIIRRSENHAGYGLSISAQFNRSDWVTKIPCWSRASVARESVLHCRSSRYCRRDAGEDSRFCSSGPATGKADTWFGYSNTLIL